MFLALSDENLIYIQWAAPDPATALGCAKGASAQVSGHAVWDTRHTKVWQKTNPKNSKKVCEISPKIVENWSQEAPRGTQNHEKWSLGGTLEPSWGVLGTQVDPRWKKDDFLGLSPPPPRTPIFSLFRFFSAFFSNFFLDVFLEGLRTPFFKDFPMIFDVIF